MDQNTTPEQDAQVVTGPQRKSNNLVVQLFAVVVLLLLVAGGVYYWQNSRVATLNTQVDNLNKQVSELKDANNKTKSTSNSAPATTSTTKPDFTFNIKDLELSFTAPGELDGLTYQVVALKGDQAVNSVEFATQEQISAGCKLSSAPLGYLTYDDDKGGVKVATVNSSGVYYIKPTGSCAAANYTVLQTALSTLVSTVK